jgi:hypothetical protein
VPPRNAEESAPPWILNSPVVTVDNAPVPSAQHASREDRKHQEKRYEEFSGTRPNSTNKQIEANSSTCRSQEGEEAKVSKETDQEACNPPFAGTPVPCDEASGKCRQGPSSYLDDVEYNSSISSNDLPCRVLRDASTV